MAKHPAITDPRNTIHGMENLIEGRYDDPQNQNLTRMVPYSTVGNGDGEAVVEANDMKFSSTKICASILAEIKNATHLVLHII